MNATATRSLTLYSQTLRRNRLHRRRVRIGQRSGRLICEYNPLIKPVVNVEFIGRNRWSLSDCSPQQRSDCSMLHIRQHTNHNLATTLNNPEDRRPLLFQCATISISFQTPPSPYSPFFQRCVISLIICDHIDFITLDLAMK